MNIEEGREEDSDIDTFPHLSKRWREWKDDDNFLESDEALDSWDRYLINKGKELVTVPKRKYTKKSLNKTATKRIIKPKTTNGIGNISPKPILSDHISITNIASPSANKLRLRSAMKNDQEEQSTVQDEMRDIQVATLLNMGNTCFLNSVLYALRFTPRFLHNLHHLLTDFNLIQNRYGLIPKSKEQIVSERLHDLFLTMHKLDMRKPSEPYRPQALLQAVTEVRPIFGPNNQQDAHEFYNQFLWCLEATCRELNEQIKQNPDLIQSAEPALNENNNEFVYERVLKKRGKNDAEKNRKLDSPINGFENHLFKINHNFINENFEGTSLQRIKCLECEEVSELKDHFLEIQVPVSCIKESSDIFATQESSIFGSICVSSETLCGSNKYFCTHCNHHCEAQKMILYEKLPNIMVLHLKRFTTSLSGVKKLNTYFPTPTEIRCFCKTCCSISRFVSTPHRYRLSCVIMHLGPSMESGHYMAYCRPLTETDDYSECPRSFFNSAAKEHQPSNFLKVLRGKSPLGKFQSGAGPNPKKNPTQVCCGADCCSVNASSSADKDSWLEFDDETVRRLSNVEFKEKLSKNHHTTNTPYLLFYSRI